MLTASRLEAILDRLPGLTVGVLGDLFLDRYLDLDATLTERSLETGLDAYQVVRIRPSPGALGTVLNNLTALGIKRIEAVSVIGDDGEGHELRRALRQLGPVDARGVRTAADRWTPTYTKPMLVEPGRAPRELNRLDTKTRTPLPARLELRVVRDLTAIWPRVDALIVLDQVSEAECGVITTPVRERLAEMSEADPGKIVLADSRERIGLFRSVLLKPNAAECARAVAGATFGAGSVVELARRAGRPVFCTCGEQGIWIADPRAQASEAVHVPAYPVRGPVDSVGAGDSTSAGIACALAAGASLTEAAAFGCLVASVTIQQLGTTGTATPAQLRQRWQEVQETR